MPRDKTAAHEKIVQAAKREFLEKGFKQASMRSIAARVGMSAAGLYRHFADKEALFAALVAPALAAAESWFAAHRAREYARLDQNDLDAMWEEGADAAMMMEAVYPNFDAFKLLICRSEGTRYANYLHELVMLEQKETLSFLDEARKRGYAVNEVREDELHLLLSAYVTALFEVVVHDFAPADAQHYLQTFQSFFYPGWRAILGI